MFLFFCQFSLSNDAEDDSYSFCHRVISLQRWRHDTKHNDIQHDDIQHNNTQHYSTEHNDVEHNNKKM